MSKRTSNTGYALRAGVHGGDKKVGICRQQGKDSFTSALPVSRVYPISPFGDQNDDGGDLFEIIPVE